MSDYRSMTEAVSDWGIKVNKPIGIIYEVPPDGSDDYAYACGGAASSHGGMTNHTTGVASCAKCVENLTPEARAVHVAAQKEIVELLEQEMDK